MDNIYSKELVRMTQTKVNYVKKSNRMSMKVMCVKTKELNEKATKRKKYEFLMNNVKSPALVAPS